MDNTLINIISYHFLTYRKITSMEAFQKYGITRLSSIVRELRLKGYPIETTMVEGVNRYNNKVRYGVYSIPQNWSLKDLGR